VGAFVVNRLLQAAATLFFLSIVVFGMSRATGDPLDLLLPLTARPEDYALLSRHLGLDQPLPVQYARFAGNALRGDLGRSIRSGEPVVAVVARRLVASTGLTLFAMLLILSVGATTKRCVKGQTANLPV
jgi:peptide/nickel transport system permease protein